MPRRTASRRTTSGSSRRSSAAPSAAPARPGRTNSSPSFAARQMRRPVKLVLTRKQMYGGIGYRPDQHGSDWPSAPTGRAASSAIVARRAHRDRAVRHLRGRSHRVAEVLYTSPNMRSTYRVVPLDVNLPTYMRGPGATTRHVRPRVGDGRTRPPARHGPDRAAAAQRTDRDQTDGLPFSTRRLDECLRQGASTFGWPRRNPTPRRARRRPADRHRAWPPPAIDTVAQPPRTSWRGSNADGTADVQTATSDMGPGTYTSMTQVAADALGLPVRRVRFALGDSQYPNAPSHSGSRTMASVGSAVFTAGNMLRDRLIRTAVMDPKSPLSGTAPQDVTVVDGRHVRDVAEPGRGETYQDLLAAAAGPAWTPRQTWSPDDADEAVLDVRLRRGVRRSGRRRIARPRPGEAHLRRLRRRAGDQPEARRTARRSAAWSAASAWRCWRAPNSTTATAGSSTPTCRDYLVPVNADVPALDAAFLTAEDSVADPIGVKGLGEIVIVGVPRRHRQRGVQRDRQAHHRPADPPGESALTWMTCLNCPR